MKSALTLWANLEAARDDSSMMLLFRHSVESSITQDARLPTSL